MSRSLGDGCLKKYGVTPTPDVQDVSGIWAACEAPIAVLASDGLWDTINAQETVASLFARAKKGQDVKRGAEVLLRRSQKLWVQGEGDYCDDCTVILLAPTASLKSRKQPTARAAAPTLAASSPVQE